MEAKGTLALRRLVDRLYEQYVSAADQALFDFVFSNEPTQESLDRCLDACDIEVVGADKAVLLSYVGYEHPELKFSDYAGPRIKGLNTYFRFKNVKVLSHFSRIGKAYNEARIPMLLFKGGAMKVLRPNLPRPMGDVDILIPAERIDEATAIGESLGYMHIWEESKHAVDFHTETESAVDVHHALFDPEAGCDQTPLCKALFARATPYHAFGVDFLLPCHEDLCFLVMNNLTKNLREHTSLHGIYFSLCDCNWLQKNKPEFDWRLVRENAAACGREMETRFAAEFMNHIAPGLIPDPDRHLPGRAMEEFCNQVVYDEDYFLPRRLRCQQLLVLELKKEPYRWGMYIFKYLIMRRFRKNPAFVRWFLRRKEHLEVSHVH